MSHASWLPDGCHLLVRRPVVLPHDPSAPAPGTGCPSPPVISGLPSLECPSVSDLSAKEILRSVPEPPCHDSVAARQTVCAHAADTVIDDAVPETPPTDIFRALSPVVSTTCAQRPHEQSFDTQHQSCHSFLVRYQEHQHQKMSLWCCRHIACIMSRAQH